MKVLKHCFTFINEGLHFIIVYCSGKDSSSRRFVRQGGHRSQRRCRQVWLRRRTSCLRFSSQKQSTETQWGLLHLFTSSKQLTLDRRWHVRHGHWIDVGFDCTIVHKWEIWLDVKDDVKPCMSHIRGIFKKYVDFMCVGFIFDHVIIYYVLTRACVLL